VGVFPRYPREDGFIDSLVQKYEETEWESDSELGAREAHEAKVMIGFEDRGVAVEDRGFAVEEFRDHPLALYIGAEGEHSVGDGDEGEDARPHPEKWKCKCGVVHGERTSQALDDVCAVTLNDVV